MKPTLLIMSVFALLCACTSPPGAVAPDLSRPSIAQTHSVIFDGKTFVLKFQKNGLREYFPEKESVDAWNEMVDFTVVPAELSRFTPLELGTRTVQLHQKENPQMPAELSQSVTTIGQEIVPVIKAFPLYRP
ncbi:hypothetical protein [Pseudomonas sp. 1152_12]|uniref:hypothetical protein n=1 Tax=Pseudomonas sp. 1152_12 TaxID=2604455 RepID=UPI0040641054